MNVRLPPDLERFVVEEVKAGHFASRDDVIKAALARLMLDPPEQDLDPQTLAAIEEAEAQIDRGEGMPLNEAFDQLKKKHLGT